MSAPRVLMLVGLAFHVATLSPAIAATIFHDDFADGSILDGTPVAWIAAPAPRDPASSMVIGGDLVITPSVVAPYASSAGYHEGNLMVNGLVLSDVTIQTQIRAPRGRFSTMGLVVRDTYDGPGLVGDNLYAGLSSDGYLGFGYTHNDRYFDSPIPFVPTPLRYEESDVVVELEIIGNKANLSAWLPDQPRPSSPQVTWHFPSNIPSSGHIGMYVGSGSDGPSPLTLRYVEVSGVPELSCDFDGNLTCDLSDVNALTRVGDLVRGVVPGNPGYDDKYDLVDDNIVNGQDLEHWLAEAASQNGWDDAYFLGDTDLNGKVEFADFVNLNNNWQQTHLNSGETVAWQFGDFNGDTIVDFTDFVDLNNNWQRMNTAASAAATVPEPTGIAIIFSGLLVCGVLRRRGVTTRLPNRRDALPLSHKFPAY